VCGVWVVCACCVYGVGVFCVCMCVCVVCVYVVWCVCGLCVCVVVCVSVCVWVGVCDVCGVFVCGMCVCVVCVCNVADFLNHHKFERAVSDEDFLISFIVPNWNHKPLAKYFQALRTFLSECKATGASSWRPTPSFTFIFLLARQPSVGYDLLIHDVSKSHTTTQP